MVSHVAAMMSNRKTMKVQVHAVRNHRCYPRNAAGNVAAAVAPTLERMLEIGENHGGIGAPAVKKVTAVAENLVVQPPGLGK